MLAFSSVHYCNEGCLKLYCPLLWFSQGPLKLPTKQLLALFNKTMRKLHSLLHSAVAAGHRVGAAQGQGCEYSWSIMQPASPCAVLCYPRCLLR